MYSIVSTRQRTYTEEYIRKSLYARDLGRQGFYLPSVVGCQGREYRNGVQIDNEWSRGDTARDWPRNSCLQERNDRSFDASIVLRLGVVHWWLCEGDADYTGSTSGLRPSSFQDACFWYSPTRPAILVDILDASESPFTDAELYLAVQSSQFPSATCIVLPLTHGDFEGVEARFVQLPFEIREGDTLLFNLLDEDSLTKVQEEMLLAGCKAAAYCVFHAGQVYEPKLAQIARPVINATMDAIGTSIIDECDLHSFESYGKAEFIVPHELPRKPTLANKLTLLDSLHAHVQLRIYGSDNDFSATEAPLR